MTPTPSMLAVFESKSKEVVQIQIQVVQIQIQVSHVEAVLTRVEFAWTVSQMYSLVKIIQYGKG